MERIIDANNANLQILGKAKSSDSDYRLTKYCVTRHIDDGVLLFHMLTRELLFLTEEEYELASSSAYLREHWFVVPVNLDEKKQVDLVRLVRSGMRKKNKNITKYTILTTTECNARCFYCYERGYARKTMSEETAREVVSYVKAHCGGEEVKISWFGGEPLVNISAIETISEGLREEGVAFSSSMISNGYLFDEDVIAKAVKQWNLKKVQITLDGTEDIYNRSKAFVYREGSAYQVVLGNISRLLDAQISVQIRLNVGPANAENLLILIDELAERFKHQAGLNIYARMLFDTDKPQEDWYTAGQWRYLYDSLERIDSKIDMYGMGAGAKRGLKRDISFNQCMADSDNAVVIVPDGHLGVCEHFAESEFIGQLGCLEKDEKVIASWKERCDEIPECRDCFYYPTCNNLKKCPDRIICNEYERTRIRRSIERAMENEYAQVRSEQETE